MNEVPKIVHHRLRTVTPAQEPLRRTHPDADLLNAFAEQALAASEREDVLQHLALCADCRDTVAVALPEVQAATPPTEEETEVIETGVAEHRSNRFSWPNFGWAHLRWATLAAGIAVAVFVVRPGLERVGKPHPAVNSAANQRSAPAAQPESPSQVASSTQPANPVTTSLADTLAGKGSTGHPVDAAGRPLEKEQAGNEKREEDSASGVGGKAGVAGARSVILAHPRMNVPTQVPEMQLAGNMPLAGGKVKQSGRAKTDAISAGMLAGSRQEYSRSAAAKDSQADESAFSGATAGNPSTTVEVASEPGLMARADGLALPNAPKIEKAKPALDETSRDAAVNGMVDESKTPAQRATASPAAANSQAEIAQLSVTSKATAALNAPTPSAKLQKQNATWTIADGVLQRSVDGGHTWQPAARAPVALLCYANRGQDMWAGGQAGTVLHSADDGATWIATKVTFNGQSLSSDVVNLSLQGPAQIVLSTSTHEIWSSADAGKTWEKK